MAYALQGLSVVFFFRSWYKSPRIGGFRGQNRHGLVNIDRFAKLSNCVTNNVIGNSETLLRQSVTKLLVSLKAKL
jgi:hypothetical protein